jgi:hypothetical protein
MMSRAKRDLDECLEFIATHPWGNAAARERDILWEIRSIRGAPEHRRIEIVRKGTGVELRRRSAAQFVIIYTYFKPKKRRPRGVVSIRAIRHRRVRDVFSGVREPDLPPGEPRYHT